MTIKVAVWDLPVRLFHWCLVISVLTAVTTGLYGGDALELHMQAGYVIVVLVAFRLLWGFFGSTYARFDSFLYSPRAILDYGKKRLRGEIPAAIGHNPLAGWMIALMLVVLAIQTVTGLCANDDIMVEGPLFHLVSKHTSDLLTAVHKINFLLIASLAAVHVVTIVGFYLLVKRTNLIKPMLTGHKVVPKDHAPADHRIAHHTNLLAFVLLVLLALALYLFVLPR